MKKENINYVSWIALVLSTIAILLWLCKYEPVTWTLFDSMIAFLSFVVGSLAVMVGYNIFGLKNDLKNEIEEKLQDISDHHVIHTAKTMMYIEMRLLHMAVELNNIADIRQSIYMMIDTTEKTKNKEDIAKLEVRISKVNVNLYCRISKEIDECYERINFEEEELEHYQYLYNKFAFCSSIINNESNSENYELIYTKY